MAKNTQLNTACRATFRDGHTEDFNSIEEASEKTGISCAAIKIRANKPGCGGKEKITFEWLDEHTKLSFRAKKSKNKGASFEAEVVNKLKEIGFTDCCRAAGQNKMADNNKIDIVDPSGKLPINIQCKNLQKLPSYFTIRDACSDKSKPFCLAWKKAADGEHNSPGTVFIIPDYYFYELLAKTI